MMGAAAPERGATRGRTTATVAFAAFLGAWFLTAFAVMVLDLTRVAPDQIPWLRLFLLLGPALLLVLAYRSSDVFRSLVWRIDLRLLTVAHTARAVGIGFIALGQVGVLAQSFAQTAGWGDIVAGLTAPFVALLLLERRPLPARAIVAWNLFGIVDFVAAVSANMLGSRTALGLLRPEGGADTELMARYPLGIIPTFFVPLLVLSHLLVIVRVRRAND
jgi:hypothetical protein